MNVSGESPTQQKRPDPSSLNVFFKYFSDDEQVIKGIFEDRKIRFTQPWALNDPLEANPTIMFKDRSDYRWFRCDGITLPSREQWIRLHLIERRINKFGILSLTEVPNSFDMWSRYANGHKGFLLCLKPDFNERPCMLSPKGGLYPIERVEYPPAHLMDMAELVNEHGRLQMKVVHQRLFLQKTLRWEGEREHRMVRPLSEAVGYRPLADGIQKDTRVHLFDFSLDCILGVIFGACMSVENKRRIIRICESAGIEYDQALILRDKHEEDAHGGRIGKVGLPLPEHSSKLIDICPCIVDSAHIEDQENKEEIGSLSELPYYTDDPEWVQEWFDNLKKRQGNKSQAREIPP